MMKTEKLYNEYKDVEFKSSSTKTEQFKSFARKFKNALKEQAELAGYKIDKYSVGHFEISAFLINEEGKYYYISTVDVRNTPGKWFKELLYREAESNKDYSGGRNQYTNLSSLHEKI